MRQHAKTQTSEAAPQSQWSDYFIGLLSDYYNLVANSKDGPLDIEFIGSKEQQHISQLEEVFEDTFYAMFQPEVARLLVPLICETALKDNRLRVKYPWLTQQAPVRDRITEDR